MRVKSASWAKKVVRFVVVMRWREGLVGVAMVGRMMACWMRMMGIVGIKIFVVVAVGAALLDYVGIPRIATNYQTRVNDFA